MIRIAVGEHNSLALALVALELTIPQYLKICGWIVDCINWFCGDDDKLLQSIIEGKRIGQPCSWLFIWKNWLTKNYQMPRGMWHWTKEQNKETYLAGFFLQLPAENWFDLSWTCCAHASACWWWFRCDWSDIPKLNDLFRSSSETCSIDRNGFTAVRENTHLQNWSFANWNKN